ncbi:MAG: hypothetical protein IH961_06830, partial [Chloroflexi bacterium]|nr:hypothetical protein [Chloroflexota bacterium]
MEIENRLPDYFLLDRYNITAEDVAREVLKCDQDQIRPAVILSPFWARDVIGGLGGEAQEIVEGRLWNVVLDNISVTVIKTGLGAPANGDIVLALGVTPCRTVLFTGSAGGLDQAFEIGDLIIETWAVSGDGWSRNLHPAEVPPDRYLEKVYPDEILTSTLREIASTRCSDGDAALHEGPIYATDSILAQFPKVEYAARELNCIGVEMETAAVFNAARLVGIRAAALLQLSDVIPAKKSLFSGRTPADHAQIDRPVARSACRGAADRVCPHPSQT